MGYHAGKPIESVVCCLNIIYLSEIINKFRQIYDLHTFLVLKRYLQKYQVRFNNVTLQGNKKQLKVSSLRA